MFILFQNSRKLILLVRNLRIVNLRNLFELIIVMKNVLCRFIPRLYIQFVSWNWFLFCVTRIRDIFKNFLIFERNFGDYFFTSQLCLRERERGLDLLYFVISEWYSLSSLPRCCFREIRKAIPIVIKTKISMMDPTSRAVSPRLALIGVIGLNESPKRKNKYWFRNILLTCRKKRLH